MGADFLFATFPRFELTEERLAELLQAGGVDVQEAGNELRDEFYELEDLSDSAIIGRLTEKLQDAAAGSSCEYSRMLVRNDQGRAYYANITGGMSWGESPTAAFDVVCLLDRLDTVSALAERFALEDYHELYGS